MHIVAIDPNFHYVFNEFGYDDVKDKDDKGRVLVRYPLPTDEFTFTPTTGFASRQYKQRCVVMLADDPEHKLFIVDFGYNSIKKLVILHWACWTCHNWLHSSVLSELESAVVPIYVPGAVVIHSMKFSLKSNSACTTNDNKGNTKHDLPTQVLWTQSLKRCLTVLWIT